VYKVGTQDIFFEESFMIRIRPHGRVMLTSGIQKCVAASSLVTWDPCVKLTRLPLQLTQ